MQSKRILTEQKVSTLTPTLGSWRAAWTARCIPGNLSQNCLWINRRRKMFHCTYLPTYLHDTLIHFNNQYVLLYLPTCNFGISTYITFLPYPTSCIVRLSISTKDILLYLTTYMTLWDQYLYYFFTKFK